ncbi:hypothetical protein FNF29_05320 [Cafeteria roenbergensis]|uniref:Peptidase M14 domain-containing protein n=2 Tax=Cafeteria roenbergensis TaxID=33653 RepID=A0A5A8CBS8_CAFRO|nr:hypothetical protein FNF29_05320 [Cafeteria roenbergensis]|eukprot:KAA0150308.1 hypothetical protein FNF29_05320 [Cafeteria roenbergensis]
MATEAGDAAATPAGDSAVGGGEPSEVRRFQVKRLTFCGDFDGANIALARASIDADGITEVYEVHVAPDCSGTKHEAEYKMWYHFSVEGGRPGQRARIAVANLNPMAKVYAQDLRPLVRVPSLSPSWERLAEPSSFEISGPRLRLTFAYTFGSAQPVHFALYFPFAYSDCQRLLRNIDFALGSEPSTAAAASRIRSGAAPPGRGPSGRSRLRARLRNTGDPSADIYYHRELLALSPEGRRVELLTVSSCLGRLAERLPHIDGLFPERGPRPHRFKAKPVVYIGARVHPGETAASYMLHGMLAFLLQPRNPYARALRNRFVFQVVPMVNPDGVARGHFRADIYGGNLNRQYANPSPTKQPAIFAIRAVLKQACAHFSPVPLEGGARGGGTPVFAYIDLHGFTARHGCYVIGNALPPHRESRSLMLAQLLQLYAPQFNANACAFGRGKRGQGPKRALYGTPFGQLVPSTLTPAAGQSDGGGRTSAAGAPAAGAATAGAGEGTEAGGEDGGATAGDEDGDGDGDGDEDEEDGADAAATHRSEAEDDEDAAALADAARREGRSSPPLVDGRWLEHECYPGELARLHDPFSTPPNVLQPGELAGPASARLSEAEAGRVSRDWSAMKARITGKTEGTKDGTGRVCAMRDFGVQHCYTVECSCNLLPHRRVYDRIYAASHLHHCTDDGHHASAHGEIDPDALAARPPSPPAGAGRPAAAPEPQWAEGSPSLCWTSAAGRGASSPE